MTYFMNLASRMRLSILTLFLIVVSFGPAHAIDIQQIETKSGIKALLVEDYTLPIIAMSFSFEGGATQDEEGKAGTLRLMSALMDEGAGDLDNLAFQSRMEELGIEIGFSASADRFSGSLRLVRSDLQSATELLSLAINKPRFDQEAIDRMYDALRTNLERSETDPGFQSRRAFRKTLFAGHPYERNVAGSVESLANITRDDIVEINKKILARNSLTIGVVGAINAYELSAMLETVFGSLQADPQLKAVTDVEPKLGEEITIDMPTPNASIQLVYKGVKRSDPDFFAAHLMNHILGGGSFTSRLYEEVREKRGLAYGVYSAISTSRHSQFLVAGTSTRADNGEETIKIIKQEIKRMVDEGVSEEELAAAKQFVAGSYAISNLDTSGKIARVLVALQTENLGLDYIDTRSAQINAVTVEDVNRLAKQLLSVDPTLIVVRPPITQ